MKQKPYIKFFLYTSALAIALGLGLLFLKDINEPMDQSSQEVAASEIPQETHYKGKKILFVDSYHNGYEWSDGVEQGVRNVLGGTGVELRTIEMDTKRNVSEEFKKNAAKRVKEEIEAFQPDVVISSDDNAFKYVIQEYYKDADLPVVFCGLNWDASVYGAPYSNTTGVVEVALTLRLIDYLEQYSNGAGRVGYLSADVLTERKNLDQYKRILNLDFDAAYFVKTMEEWKEAFKSLQDEVDVIVFENNAGIVGWDADEAERFALANIEIPIGTTNEWVMRSSLLGLTKVPEEQGELSAQAALQILDGKNPSEIPVVTNEKGDLVLNFKLTKKLGIVFSSPMLKSAKSVIQ